MSDLSSFIRRVSAVSVIEIEKVIAELETLRAAERGSARPAGDCGICAHESGGDQGHGCPGFLGLSMSPAIPASAEVRKAELLHSLGHPHRLALLWS